MIFDASEPEVLSRQLFAAAEAPVKVLESSHGPAHLFDIPWGTGVGHVESVRFEDGLHMLMVNGTWRESKTFTAQGDDRVRMTFRLNLAHALVPEDWEDAENTEGWRIVLATPGKTATERLDANQPQKWIELTFPVGYFQAFVAESEFRLEDLRGLLAEFPSRDQNYWSFPFDYQLNYLATQVISLAAHDAVYVRLLHIKAMELISIALDRILSLQSAKQDARFGMRPKDVQAISLAREIIVNSLPNMPTIVELCHSVGVNRNKLNEGFKMFIGLSPAQFMEEHRLTSAYDLLRDPAKRLYEVAMEVGYDSPGSFSTAFKRHFGMTPKAARQALLAMNERDDGLN